MNRITIQQILHGDVGNLLSTFQIRRKGKKKYPSGAIAVELDLSDLTGQFKSKYFTTDESADKIISKIKLGDIYEFIGSYSNQYKSFTIESLKKIENYNLNDFVFIPDINADALMDEINTIIEGLQNQYLIKLCDVIFKDKELVAKFKKIPSAKKYHHAYPCGNIEHVVGVLRICKTLIEFYHNHDNEHINKDLLYVGAIFHDIGKIFTYKEHNGVITVTEEGSKIDHIVLGNNYILKMIERIENFPKDLEINLLHMILSHHGRIDWGSPVEPRTPEAELLHYADLLDSRFKKALEGKYE
ncbi:MAG: HD domain-containing protein [Candidatus Helarchaeota archaeon]